jgi:uncharacterized protein (TIGR03067 family)
MNLYATSWPIVCVFLLEITIAAQIRPVKCMSPDDIKLLQGVWEISSVMREGELIPIPKTRKGSPPRLRFEGTEIFVIHDGFTYPWVWATFMVDQQKKPKSIDLTLSEKRVQGIYEIDGDTLRWCLHPVGERPSRPTGFSSTANNRQSIEVWKRVRQK